MRNSPKKYNFSGCVCLIQTTDMLIFCSIKCVIYFAMKNNRGENQTLVGAMSFCDEYSGPWFEVKFRSANQMYGISKAG